MFSTRKYGVWLPTQTNRVEFSSNYMKSRWVFQLRLDSPCINEYLRQQLKGWQICNFSLCEAAHLRRLWSCPRVFFLGLPSFCIPPSIVQTRWYWAISNVATSNNQSIPLLLSTIVSFPPANAITSWSNNGRDYFPRMRQTAYIDRLHSQTTSVCKKEPFYI